LEGQGLEAALPVLTERVGQRRKKKGGGKSRNDVRARGTSTGLSIFVTSLGERRGKKGGKKQGHRGARPAHFRRLRRLGCKEKKKKKRQHAGRRSGCISMGRPTPQGKGKKKGGALATPRRVNGARGAGGGTRGFSGEGVAAEGGKKKREEERASAPSRVRGTCVDSR